MKVLVLNAGSSSLKFTLFDMTDKSVLCKCMVLNQIVFVLWCYLHCKQIAVAFKTSDDVINCAFAYVVFVGENAYYICCLFSIVV